MVSKITKIDEKSLKIGRVKNAVFEARLQGVEGFGGSIFKAPETRQHPENSNIAWEVLQNHEKTTKKC